jgi:O-antigen/teichoic acid export membrane protein
MTDTHHSRLRWSFLSTFSTAAMQLVASVTITRFLQPSDYGLSAMAMLCYALTGYLTQLGMGRAIMQKPGLTEGNIRAAFWLSILTGLSGFTILAALSPALGVYFREPRLPVIILVFGLNLISQSSASVTGGLLRREFRMRDLAICDFLGYLLSTFGIGLPMAMRGFGVWALVGSNVSQPLIVAIAYFVTRPHSLKPTFARADYRHITVFSWKAALTTGVEAAGGSLDTIVMGRLVSPAALGLYNRAHTLSTMPPYNISMGLTRVFYPTLARAAERSRAECLEILVKSQRQMMSLVLPLCTGAAVAAATIIPAIFGRQWTPAIPVFRALCLVAALDASFHLPSIQLEVLSLFRYKLMLQVVFGLCFGASIIYFAAHGGIVAVALAYAVLNAARTLTLHSLSARALSVNVVSILQAWIPGLICAALVGLVLLLTQTQIPGILTWNLAVRLIVLMSLSAVTLAAFYRIFFRSTVYQPWVALFRRDRGITQRF